MIADGTESSKQVLVEVTGLDHIGLRVSDVEASLAFYADLLGLETERVDQWRRGEVTFPSVRLDNATLIDFFPTDPYDDSSKVQNQDHFCLVIRPTDLNLLKRKCEAIGIGIQAGPGSRWGAQGKGTSLYLYDPDRNVVELRYY